MPYRRHKKASYFVLVILTALAFTLAYDFGMSALEGDPRTFTHSLQVVFQTFTTTGYGEDAPWRTPQMHLLVILMQLAGIGLILTGVDVFAVPWLRDALAPTPPDAARAVVDHVVICGYTPRTETVLEELESRERSRVVVEPDEEVAIDLHEADVPVVHGDPEAVSTLEAAHVGSARAVVIDMADDTSASIALSVREVDAGVEVITLIEDRSLSDYHRLAGASTVLSPRQLLGESLARKIPTAVTTNVDEALEIGEDFELVELPVEAGSDLDGRAIGAADIRDRTGATVVGAWFGGEFHTPVEPNDELDDDTVLLVSGEHDQLRRLEELTASRTRQLTSHRVVVAGRGETGTAAHDALSRTASEVTVLDIEDKDGVDVVGDARSPETLREAGIGDASAIILALADDTTAVFAALIARDLNPEVRIVVRASDEGDVGKLYRAGADYVQSLAVVSGRMVASTIFEDEDVLAYDTRIEIVRVPAGDLAGRTLAEANVRSETGCTVVAVERDGDTHTDLDPWGLTFEPDDEVILAGTSGSVDRFEERF